MLVPRSPRFFAVAALAALAAAGCGDNKDATSDGGVLDGATPIAITVTVSGLAGAGLVLQDNGGDDLAIASSGTYTFAAALPVGAAYDVTVATQPVSPAQTCTVSGGSGTVGTAPIAIAVACATQTFTVGGTVSGLTGTGLVLENNHGDDLTVSANGAFTFATPLPSGSAFSVTVLTQPAGPAQSCTVSGGSGTIGAGNVTSVVVDCAENRFTVGGVIDGLAGSVVLQNNGGDDLTVTSSGSFAFATTLPTNAAYAVTVATQPGTPSQQCVVEAGTGSGTIQDADVTSVRVHCTTNAFTIGGTVTGLVGAGLVLQDNAGDNLAVGSDGPFTFPAAVASGSAYAVTVLAQPTNPTQTCVVTHGSGTVGAATVSDVAIACTATPFTIGGTVSGLTGTGLVLQDNAGDDLAIAGNGPFTFPTAIASGGHYAVTIHAQPTSPAQTCTVSAATGTVGGGNVTSVVVNCATDSFTIGGTVTGLAGTLTLLDNGADPLVLTGDGTFAFSKPIASGQPFAVTVGTQPGAPSQTCAVQGGSGTVGAADITSVQVTCTTNTFRVGGTVTGLVGTGLVLQDNGGDNLAVSANGAFTFPTAVASGATYDVTVRTQPTGPSQTCTATNATGTVGAAPVTTVAITCVTNTFAIGGTVTGLAGTGLLLRDNGTDSLAVTANGSFHFTTRIASGGTYAVTLVQNPTNPTQVCSVASPTGTVTTADITSIRVTCTTRKFTIGGSVVGLTGSGLLLQDNGGNNLAVSANGTFTFTTPVASGQPYAVTVLAQPTNPNQTCSVNGASGTVGAGNVTSVVVNCAVTTHVIGGTVTGLAGSGLVLRNLGNGDDRSITANGTFAFAATVNDGDAYNVTVLTQPGSPAQTCTIVNGSGTATADVTNIAVTCVTDRFHVNVTVSGLAAGDAMTLRDNGADDLAVTGNGTVQFATSLPSGATYSVTTTSPTSPVAQTCTVSGGGGTIGSADVSSVTVTCQ